MQGETRLDCKGSRKNNFPYWGAETLVWQGVKTAHILSMGLLNNSGP